MNADKMGQWWPPRLRVAEAMALLVIAKLLVRLVPLRWWRDTLGRVCTTLPTNANDQSRLVVRAVIRATQRLRGDYVCLPRAMAVQWMLRRRGQASALVFGIMPNRESGDIHALHAWVEAGGKTVIGADPTRTYARGLTLVQP